MRCSNYVSGKTTPWSLSTEGILCSERRRWDLFAHVLSSVTEDKTEVELVGHLARVFLESLWSKGVPSMGMDTTYTWLQPTDADSYGDWGRYILEIVSGTELPNL